MLIACLSPQRRRPDIDQLGANLGKRSTDRRFGSLVQLSGLAFGQQPHVSAPCANPATLPWHRGLYRAKMTPKPTRIMRHVVGVNTSAHSSGRNTSSIQRSNVATNRRQCSEADYCSKAHTANRVFKWIIFLRD